MSHHNISGSEVFGQRPYVVMRTVGTTGLRRKKASRLWLGFLAGAVVAGGAAGLIALAPTLIG